MKLNSKYANICLLHFLVSVLKQDVLLQLIVKFALTYDFRKVKMHHDGLTFNRAPHFLVYADDFRLYSENINTLHKNTEALLDTLTKVGPEVSTETT
jgi:hypothetical protein